MVLPPLVVPARDFWSGVLVQLTVQDDGTGIGHICGGASYMPMKSHRPPTPAPVEEHSARPYESALDPRESLPLGFALYGGTRLPGMKLVHALQGERRDTTACGSATCTVPAPPPT
ncbi:hypothetical protein [Streptomyces marispadix]|uniref:Uncharacterized protein n=1 Tax=Streptomyces marispadix TaxID=2922868 RepID=A0ABS9SXN6_9ACTN|nr:hypothetical protein [Streptomyces marispadix]MCH6161039.1 hypothetical protein [Streptomyces marispadix]